MGLIVNDGATFVTLNTPLSDNNPDFQKIWLGSASPLICCTHR
jgi:hypothetical protein